MPRPRKCRRICRMPLYSSFGPLAQSNNGVVNILVEEYEVIRLIDYEGLTQEDCAIIMGIARTSIQKMYDDVRYKIAQCLTEGKLLQVDGGNFFLCNKELKCNRRNCNNF